MVLSGPTSGNDLGSPVAWSRPEAIEKLREGLLALCDDERSMCEVAAQRGVFCHGFQRWHDAEFHRRWKPFLGQSTHLSRAQMEQLANLWQLIEQVRCRVKLACDAQTVARGPCRGWNEFSDLTLARFCLEILGRNVVVSRAADPGSSPSTSIRGAGASADPS